MVTVERCGKGHTGCLCLLSHRIAELSKSHSQGSPRELAEDKPSTLPTTGSHRKMNRVRGEDPAGKGIDEKCMMGKMGEGGGQRSKPRTQSGPEIEVY